jgi:hypothetical protein
MAPPAPSPESIAAAGAFARKAVKDALLWLLRNYSPFFASVHSGVKAGIQDAEKEIP